MLMNVRNVLVLPAGTEIGLEIFQALKHCKEVRLYGCGQDIPNHGQFVYPSYHSIPSIYEAGWLEALNDLCDELSIDYIFPAYDDVIVALAREACNLKAAVISSPLSTCETTRSKSATYRALAPFMRVPRLYADAASVTDYPVLVKPDRGQGSQGVTIARNRGDLEVALRTVQQPIICEYLPGEEYTIDCFSDRERGLLFAGARRRCRTRNGISVNTVSVTLPGTRNLASKIERELGLRGAWFFQVKQAGDGQLALLEVAPRIAGSMALHRVAGVNFPLLSIFEHERVPLDIMVNPYQLELDRALVNRYRHDIDFSSLYVDLDDTLVLNGQVNTDLITLIYQCINAGKPVKLVTRHAGDLSATLAKYRLAGLFDEVIHYTDGEMKSGCIVEPDAIFVDDSYSERREVAGQCGILTLDSSMIEILINRAQPRRTGDD